MLRLGTRPDRPRMSAPPELIAASVSSLMVATDSGMSCRFSLRRVAVTRISPTPSWASAAGESVSPVAWAAAGVADSDRGSGQRKQRRRTKNAAHRDSPLSSEATSRPSHPDIRVRLSGPRSSTHSRARRRELAAMWLLNYSCSAALASGEPSVARIRPSSTPGSLYRWPPSGTMLSSTSGHAFLSAQAAAGGVQLSWRPWTMTPGMPLQLAGVAQQLAFLEPALVEHVMVLDPGDGDRDFVGLGELLDHFGVGEQGDGLRLPTCSTPWRRASCSSRSSPVRRLR